MNPTADNYDPQANEDDGSCIIYGCTLADFPNYNSEATADDFSCDMSSADVFGCTDPSYLEYNPIAIENYGTCSVLVVYGCTGPDHCNYDSQANTDDGSCYNNDLGCGCDTPAAEDGYDCYGNQLPSIGDLYNGGMVFYIDSTGQHGLIAAMEDLGQFEWGCYYVWADGADGTDIGTGYQNTMDIVNQGCASENGGITAAQAAIDAEINGYSDWYLPSKDELVEMCNTIGYGGPDGNIGGFSNLGYWSSSELALNASFWVYFTYCLATSGGKNSANRVRAVRAF
jgi:hypothetical protein